MGIDGGQITRLSQAHEIIVLKCGQPLLVHNKAVSFSRIPTITNETHTLSVIVDKNVLGPDAVLLKGLKESMTMTNGAITKHIVEYAGSTFEYDQIDSLITTVTRDDEFTAEFTKEINDYLNSLVSG
jgi:hypothetical protein